MKNKLKTLDYNGTGIVFTADGWLNATASAQALGKTDLDNFLRSKPYQEYADVVAQANSVNSTELKKTKQGNGGGTFLHPEMAVVFARWISPAFAYWCDKQVATLIRLAQESPARIEQARTKRLQRLGRPAEVIAKRNEGVTSRLIFTNRLQIHGVHGNGFQECTRAIYFPLFGGSTDTIKKNYNLPEKANVRDYMSQVQLATLSLAESLAAERIERERAYGNVACINISNQVGQTVAAAVGQSLRRVSS